MLQSTGSQRIRQELATDQQKIINPLSPQGVFPIVAILLPSWLLFLSGVEAASSSVASLHLHCKALWPLTSQTQKAHPAASPHPSSPPSAIWKRADVFKFSLFNIYWMKFLVWVCMFHQKPIPGRHERLQSWSTCYLDSSKRWRHPGGGLVTQLCPTLVTPRTSHAHGILQARILEWVAIAFSRGPSRPRDWTRVSFTAGRYFTNWAMREAPS